MQTNAAILTGAYGFYGQWHCQTVDTVVGPVMDCDRVVLDGDISIMRSLFRHFNTMAMYCSTYCPVISNC